MNKWKLLLTCGALAASQVAFAGGPDMPPPSHSAIFIGIGGAYDYVQYKNTIFSPVLDPTIPAGSGPGYGYEDSNSVFGLAPVGQLGYDYFFGTGGFIGVKGLFNFVDKNTTFQGIGFSNNTQFTTEFNSMAAGMLEGGVRVNDNAFYLEAGYSALFTKTVLRDVTSGGQVIGSQNQTLSGGIAGIGFRHYFWDVLFIDAVYSYALYQDGTSFSAQSITTVTPDEVTPVTLTSSSQLKQVRLQDILFTVNYSFNF